MKKTGSLLLGVACLLSVLNSGCSINKTAAHSTAEIMERGIPTVEEEDDIALANLSSLSSFKILEAAQRVNPEDSTILLMLARSYGSYTFGFVENEILEAKGMNETLEKLATARAKRFYGRGKRFGVMLLSKNGNFKKTLTGPISEFQKSLSSFHKKDVPALFWAAFNWGSLINFSKDSPDAIAELPRVEAIMNRVMELDPNYFYAGPEQFFGVFYAARPPMLGGRPEDSKKFFEKALTITEGKYLMIKVLEAQFYAVQTQDKNLFKSLLSEVTSADPNILPAQRLANELAQKRAQILLQKQKMFFN